MDRYIHWIAIALFFLFPTGTLTAQIFNAGFSGGINISQIEGDGFAGYNKAGPVFGIFVNTFFQESLAWQMEILLASKGSRLRTTLEDPRYYRIDLRYIEIPLMIRYFFVSDISAEAGLSGGYLFRSREEDELGEIPVSLPFRKAEFAVHSGIVYLLSDHLSTGARISWSVIPVREHAGGGKYWFNRGQNNNVLSFTVKYQF